MIKSGAGGLKHVSQVNKDDDFDTFTTTGIYTIASAGGNNNPGITWCLMVVFKGIYDIAQLVLSQDTFKYRLMHVSNISSTWGKWHTISMS